MSDLNKTFVIGRLTRDPETKVLSNGTKVVNFAIANNEQWKDKEGNKRENTVFFELFAWNGNADFISNYLSKGDKVHVECKYKPNAGEDGRVFPKFEVFSVTSFGGKKEDKEETQPPREGNIEEKVKTTPAKRGRPAKSKVEDDDDSIPF